MMASTSRSLRILLLLGLVAVAVVGAQPPPPSRRFDSSFHSRALTDFACSSTAGVAYLLDSTHAIIAVNTSAPYTPPVTRAEWDILDFQGDYIEVDAASNVYVSGVWTVNSGRSGMLGLRVFDAQLRPLRNISLDALRPPPPPYTDSLQLAVDSQGWMYLLSSEWYSPGDGSMWVLDGKGNQMDAYKANVPIYPAGSVNATSYILAIDSTDTLYLQQASGAGLTFLLSTGNDVEASLDLFRREPRTDFDRIADLVVADDGTLYIAEISTGDVAVFDINGRRLPSLAVLSGGSGSSLADNIRLDLSSDGSLLVMSPSDETVHVVTPSNGAVTRVIAGQVAPMRGLRGLVVDPRTGELLVTTANGDGTLARRVDARDVSLLQDYHLPHPPGLVCSVSVADVGRSGLLYLALICGIDGPSPMFEMHVRIVQRSGKLQSELRVPVLMQPGSPYPSFLGDALRVDEEANRLYLIGDSVFDSPDQDQAMLLVMDLQGRFIANATFTGSISSAALAPSNGRHRQIALLDWLDGGRVLFFDSDGGLQWVQQLGPHDHFEELAFTGNGDMYVLWSDDDAHRANTTAPYAIYSAIVRYDRTGREMERFTADDPYHPNVWLDHMALGDDALYAFASNYNDLFVWRRPRLEAPQANNVAAPIKLRGMEQ